jgi:hypothetical protein
MRDPWAGLDGGNDSGSGANGQTEAYNCVKASDGGWDCDQQNSNLEAQADRQAVYCIIQNGCSADDLQTFGQSVEAGIDFFEVEFAISGHWLASCPKTPVNLPPRAFTWESKGFSVILATVVRTQVVWIPDLGLRATRNGRYTGNILGMYRGRVADAPIEGMVTCSDGSGNFSGSGFII